MGVLRSCEFCVKNGCIGCGIQRESILSKTL
jgi:hypothetical protein